MAGIPEEILTDILLRLPAQSLARFKFVSQRWRSLISDPEFVRLQLHRAMSRDPFSCSRILFIGDLIESISIESLNKEAHVSAAIRPTTVLRRPTGGPGEAWINYFVGSCNGLVCLLQVNYVTSDERFFLLNPTTRELRELPNLDAAPKKAGFFYGFGHDSPADDYKLVRIHGVPTDGVGYGPDSITSTIDVYSLVANSWRRIHVEAEEMYFQTSSSDRGVGGFGVYAGGSIHWLRKIMREPEDVLVSFDVSSEVLHETIPMAGIDDSEDHPFGLEGLRVSGDNLFVYRGLNVGIRFETLVMKWDGKAEASSSSWIKTCSVSVVPLPLGNVNKWRRMVPLDITRDGKIVMGTLLGSEMYTFDPNIYALEKFEFMEGKIVGFGTYVESLISPYGNGGRI